MEISIIIPLFNEEAGVEKLLSRTVSAIKQTKKDYEIIVVDDGSTDKTLPLLLQHREKNPDIKVLQLSRNFGHQAAYTAGMHKANGKFVVLMDGDLQDPPELIVQMYDKISTEDFDVVYGKRTNSSQISRRPLLARTFHKLFKRLSGFPDMDNVGNFSIMNKRALEAVLSYKESVRYLPALRRLIGFQQGSIEYERAERFTGESKMRISQLLSLSSDAIFSFSKVPIKICLYLGIIGIIIFFLAGVYTLVAKLTGIALLGWSSTVLSIYFLGSIQLTFLGVIGEYVYRIYKESQNRPLYFVREFHK